MTSLLVACPQVVAANVPCKERDLSKPLVLSTRGRVDLRRGPLTGGLAVSLHPDLETSIRSQETYTHDMHIYL